MKCWTRRNYFKVLGKKREDFRNSSNIEFLLIDTERYKNERKTRNSQLDNYGRDSITLHINNIEELSQQITLGNTSY